jgi:hypothetical protein
VDMSNSLETDNVTSITDDGDRDILIIKAIYCLIRLYHSSHCERFKSVAVTGHVVPSDMVCINVSELCPAGQECRTHSCEKSTHRADYITS